MMLPDDYVETPKSYHGMLANLKYTSWCYFEIPWHGDSQHV